MGLDPIMLGSGPEPKADTQPLCHPGAPKPGVLKILFIYLGERVRESIHAQARGEAE